MELCDQSLWSSNVNSPQQKPCGLWRLDGGVDGGADGGVDGGADGGVDGGADGGVDGGADGGAGAIEEEEGRAASKGHH